jgi:DNA repair protein RadA/Sms
VTKLTDFLAAFFPDEDEVICLRASKAKGAPDAPDNRPLVEAVNRRRLAEDAELQGRMIAANRTRGWYFVVNAGGNADADITRFNAFFVEIDDLPLDEQHRRYDAAPLRPSIRLETRKSAHAYWLIEGGCAEAEWRDVQARLIAYFGGDEKIKNPARVMRLPYFNHLRYDAESAEYEYKRVELTHFEPELRYTTAEMYAAFPAPSPKVEPPTGVPPDVSGGAGAFTSWDELNAEAARRIRQSAEARTDGRGWTHAPGVCHGSAHGKALFVSPDGAYGCHNGCEKARVRAALGLPERPAGAEAESHSPQAQPEEAPALRVVCMADVEPEQVSWLWHPYIALGKLTILEGDPGLGKSWLTCALASAVTRGRGLPGCEPFEAGNVLMLSAEDGLADTLRPRLDAVGADVRRVHALGEPLTLDAPGLLRLEAAIIERTPVLVIVDPLFAFTGGKVDIHRANECRAISAPLAALAERHGCAMLAVRHLGKARGGGHALNAGIGSIDFAAAARSVLLVGRDPDDETKRAVVQTKNNLAPHGASVGYRLEGDRFYWTGESDLTAGRILSVVSNDEERGALAEALDFLRSALSGGEREVDEVKGEARRAGISEATLRRARERLNLKAIRQGIPGTRQRFVWRLGEADGDQSPADGDQAAAAEHHQTSEQSKSDYGNDLADDAHVSVLERHRAGSCAASAPDGLLSEEEEEFAARLEYMEGLPRAEAERRAREWFAPVPF